ncbi:MAG: hypothetical protein ACI8TX_003790 [Hyphomicrobiaceae bacterium]|jgi:hypothetical protein
MRLSSTFLAALGLALLLVPAPTRANATVPGCEFDASALATWRAEIASSPDVDTARARVLADTQLARTALTGASRVAFWSDDLNSAAQRLDAFEQAVASASTSKEVASSIDEFAGAEAPLMLAGASGAAVDVNSPDCHYTGGEIVAIVIGLILGIIPGILLLFLLC